MYILRLVDNLKEIVEGLYFFIIVFLLVEYWLNIIFMFVLGKVIYVINMKDCMKVYVYCIIVLFL